MRQDEGEDGVSLVMALENVLCWAASVRAQSPAPGSCQFPPEGVWKSDKYLEMWAVCCWLEDHTLSNREFSSLFGPLPASSWMTSSEDSQRDKPQSLTKHF